MLENIPIESIIAGAIFYSMVIVAIANELLQAWRVWVSAALSKLFVLFGLFTLMTCLAILCPS